MSLEALCQAVESGHTDKAEDITRQLLNEGGNPSEIIAALKVAMDKLGESFARLEIFLPQLILAGNSLKAVVEIPLNPDVQK